MAYRRLCDGRLRSSGRRWQERVSSPKRRSEPMCNRALMWIGALTTAGVLGQSTSAAYTGLTVERHATVSISGTSYDVFRVYVNFSDPGDRLVIMAGSPNL